MVAPLRGLDLQLFRQRSRHELVPNFAFAPGSIFLNAHAAQPADSPASVTKSLSQIAMKHPGFSPEIVKVYRPYLTPALYSRLEKEASKQAHIGEAGDIGFDVVLDAQDTPDKFEVGKTSIDHGRAKVEVPTIFLPSEKHLLTVSLTAIGGAWKVTDIDYGPDGNLSKMLK